MEKRETRPIKKRKAGRPKGFTLTATDFKVIEKIASLSLQSYQQLREGVLKDRHRVAVWGRMKRLTREGLVRECRSDGGSILAWAVTTKGASKVYADKTVARQIAKQSPVYRGTFHHDRVLVDVREILSKSPVITHWETEAALRAAIMQKFYFLNQADRSERASVIPDALLYLNARGNIKKAALEVELSQKSRRRIFKKLETQILSPDYNFVFYVVQGEKLKEKLIEIYEDVRENAIRVKIAKMQNGIFFVSLEDIQNLKLKATFKGIESSFSFDDLEAKT